MENFPKGSDLRHYYVDLSNQMETEEKKKAYLQALEAELLEIKNQREEKQKEVTKMQREVAQLCTKQRDLENRISTVKSDSFPAKNEAPSKVNTRDQLKLGSHGF